MLFKLTILLSIFTAAQVALAQPPACLLAAINKQANPADIKSICSNKASDVQQVLQSACSGSDKSAAQSSFADTCKSAGVTVQSVAAFSSSSAAASSAAGSSASGNTKLPSSNLVVSSNGLTVSPTANPAAGIQNSSSNSSLIPSLLGTAKASGTSSGAATTGFTVGGSNAVSSASVSRASASASATAVKTGAAGRVEAGSFAGVVVAVAGVVYGLHT